MVQTSYKEPSIKGLSIHSRLAAYLRKSREDEESEDTLSKHRLQLKEFVEKNGFQNVDFYEEIGSAESINGRPIFRLLLERVEAGAYDGVLVVDYDRLSRGDMKEQGIIHEIFRNSNTLIITPNEVLDLNNKNHKLTAAFKSIFSNLEYDTIKERLQNGKINGTKEGRHTNGKPPFPYYYDKNTRSVKINEDDLKLYNYILRLFIDEELSTEQIAAKFNREGVPTISGKGRWRQSQIARILKHEFHLGYVFRNRFKQLPNGKIVKVKDPNEIIKVKGLHTPVKTEEQHAIILKRFEETRLLPPRAKKGVYLLSGLIYCGYCGHGIAFRKKTEGTQRVYLKKCRYTLPDGYNRCDDNSGCPEIDLLKALKEHMEKFQKELYEKKDNPPSQPDDNSESLIKIHKEAIDKAKERIERVKELYIDGIIDRDEFEKRRNKEEKKIEAATIEIRRLSQSNGLLDEVRRRERLERWKDVDLNWLFDDSMPIEDRREVMTRLVERIEYRRPKGQKFELDVFYW